MPKGTTSVDSRSPTGTGNSTRSATAADWPAVLTPSWMLSHVFAAAVVGLFVFLGLWQLDRLDEMRSRNQVIEARQANPVLVVDARPPTDDIAFSPVVVRGEVLDDDMARIANRSQGGVAGEYVVAIIGLGDGSLLAVNRGFVPVNAEVELADLREGQQAGDQIELTGWLRDTVEPEGWFAVEDTGQGRVLPRFDTAALAARLGRELPPVWLQVEPSGGVIGFPDPVPLPILSDGPHLSYAVQWFIFSVLGVAFYVAVVWRRAHRDPNDEPEAPPR